jgi:hypothetical protein
MVKEKKEQNPEEQLYTVYFLTVRGNRIVRSSDFGDFCTVIVSLYVL